MARAIHHQPRQGSITLTLDRFGEYRVAAHGPGIGQQLDRSFAAYPDARLHCWVAASAHDLVFVDLVAQAAAA